MHSEFGRLPWKVKHPGLFDSREEGRFRSQILGKDRSRSAKPAPTDPKINDVSADVEIRDYPEISPAAFQ
jgi:hypothetical protein